MKTFFVFLFALTTTAMCAKAQQDQTSTFPKPTETTRDEWVPHIGLLAGVATPEGDYDSTGEVGIDIGFQPYIPFGLGAEISYYNSAGDNRDLERTQALAKGTYHFGGTTALIKHSYVGLGAGAVFKSNGTALVSAPILGFDIPLRTVENMNKLSIGANAKYAVIEGSEPDSLSVVGAVKYWY